MTVNFGCALFVINFGLAIIAWSDVFPFPASFISITNSLTPLTGTSTDTILSACFKIGVFAKT